MFGKGALIVVLGLSIVFLIVGYRLASVSTKAVDNYVTYYKETSAYNISVSGANMAANEVFINPYWNAGYSNRNFVGGTLNVTVNRLADSTVRLTSVGQYMGVTKTVVVGLRTSSFAKFNLYMNILPSNMYFIGGDTVWGPLHVNSKLNVSGSPVFYGKVTTKTGLYKNPSSSTPQFYGGYQTGIDLPFPSQMDQLIGAAQSGGVFINTATTVSLTFNADGTVTYKIGSGSQQTVSLSTFAPNGVIVVDKGNIRLKGTVNGQVTVAATQSSGSGYGKIYLDDDIVYANPNLSSSDDMLGIVAWNNVIIADTPPNKSDIRIDGSIFSLKGGLGAENYDDIGPCGTIYIRGGYVCYQDQATGTFNPYTGQITSGYNTNLRYDDRFMVTAPPSYPKTSKYEVLSWLE